MKLFYEKLEHNELLWTLDNNQTICTSLAYMTTFKNYENLKVIPKQHSIEIFNDELVLSIILYVGFEINEYIENAIKRAELLFENQKERKPIDANPSTRVHFLVLQLREWITYYSYSN